jgi:hypothetical protein
MEIIIVWVLLSMGASLVANSKGRSGFAYFLLSLLLSPLVGFLVALAMPPMVHASDVRE